MDDRYRYKWWGLFGISLLAFTAFLDATIVNTALPFIKAYFQADINHLQWVANIFSIVVSMTMITIGKFGDIWGRKKIFYAGISIFALAVLGAGFSPTLEVLIFFRGLQALGAASVFVLAAALLSDVFPKRERLRVLSIYGGVTGMGLTLGPLLGGILIGLLDWRWVFWINLPLILLGFALCSFSLKGKSHENHKIKIDWASLALLIVGLGALMYGILFNAQYHWKSPLAWISFGIGVCALITLVILDEIREEALLDLHIFKERLMVLAALSCAFAGIVSAVFMFFDPLYLRLLRGLSPFMIGLLVTTIPAGQMIVSFLFERSVKWFGLSNLLLISVTSAFFSVILHRFIQEETPLFLLVIPFLLVGINWGLSNGTLIAAVHEVIAPHEYGAAIGTISTIWNIVGSIVLGASAAFFHAGRHEEAFLPAFHRAIDFNIAIAAVILAATIWVYIRLKKAHI